MRPGSETLQMNGTSSFPSPYPNPLGGLGSEVCHGTGGRGSERVGEKGYRVESQE